MHDEPGVTRDRHYADTIAYGRAYTIVDTGGFDPEDPDPMRAGIARHVMIRQVFGVGPDVTKVPIVITVFALVSSLAGSLAGHEILDDYHQFYSGIWVGTLAGLLSALIMSMLMITYYMNPQPQRG